MAFARANLPDRLADQWISLLRPAVQFADSEPGEPVALRVGGQPSLPDDIAWPSWEGRGPLSFIAEVDCAALAAVSRDTGLPKGGHLLFFFFDGRYDKVEHTSWADEPQSSAAAQYWSVSVPNVATEADDPRRCARVVYVASGIPRYMRKAPEGLEAYGSASMSARVVSTPPSSRPEAVRRDFGSAEASALGAEHPMWAESFNLGLHKLRSTYFQIGGHSRSVQGDVAHLAACWTLGTPTRSTDTTTVAAEAREWRVLLQLCDDDRLDMVWGDCGVGYWMIRADDLATARFDRTWFTLQY